MFVLVVLWAVLVMVAPSFAWCSFALFFLCRTAFTGWVGYVAGGATAAATAFGLFASAGRPSGGHTQMGFQVTDIDAVVGELRERGVEFLDVDAPGLRTVDKIADITGNYPSCGTGERAAWFHDSERNHIGLGQPTRAVS